MKKADILTSLDNKTISLENLSNELLKIGVKAKPLILIKNREAMFLKHLSMFEDSDLEMLLIIGDLEFLNQEVITKQLFLKIDDALRFDEDFKKNCLQDDLIIKKINGKFQEKLVKYRGKTYLFLGRFDSKFKKVFFDFLTRSNLDKENVKKFLLMGKDEVHLEEDLARFQDKYSNLQFVSCREPGQIWYYIIGNTKAKEEYQLALSEFYDLMDDYIISDHDNIEEVIVEILKKKNYQISIAESCTGGMLSSMIVNVPGASQVFGEGLITYSNASKIKYLQVKEETIRKYGAVSNEVVQEMIAGLKELNNAEVRIAISGIAGPDGGSLDKPVGLVHYAIGLDREIVEAKIFKGNREEIREKACRFVLYRLFMALKK